MIQAGRLRNRAVIKQPVATRGSTGEEIVTMTEVARRACRLVPQTGRENMSGPEPLASVRHMVVMRYDSTISNMTPKWELTVDGRVLKIEAVINVENRNSELNIFAIEDV